MKLSISKLLISRFYMKKLLLTYFFVQVFCIQASQHQRPSTVEGFKEKIKEYNKTKDPKNLNDKACVVLAQALNTLCANDKVSEKTKQKCSELYDEATKNRK
jgi:hypothetical protein